MLRTDRGPASRASPSRGPGHLPPTFALTRGKGGSDTLPHLLTSLTLMSPVKRNACGYPIPARTLREVVVPMDRAEERTGPEDVGEQALMRVLDTAFPFFRLGLSLSKVGRDQ